LKIGAWTPLADEMMLVRITLVVLVAVLTGCATATVDLGYAASQRGDLATAERLYMQSIREGDDVGLAWNNLGAVYSKTGRRDAALRAYNMGARYGDPTAQSNLINNGQPVPAPDLVARNNTGSDLATLVMILGGSAASPSAPPAIQVPKPASNTVKCTSTVVSPVVNTTCTK
jgi:tetratricopeptide (TPR) repeat protein